MEIRQRMRADGEGQPTWAQGSEGLGGPSGAPGGPPHGGLDLSALIVLLDAVRRGAPAELQDRVNGLIREALLTLRSLIDWYLERLERSPPERTVQDIPID
jgi:hypothetical protein